jgi:hypothetical protein
MQKKKIESIVIISPEEMDRRLDDCYDALHQRSLELCMKHDTQIVASTMLAQSLRLYKTVLTDDDFTAMVQTVVETADQIQPYKARSVH